MSLDSGPGAAVPARTRLGPVLAIGGITTFGPLPAFMLGGLAVLVRAELEFSEAQLGTAVATFFLLGAIGSTPSGHLADRIGGRRSIRLGLIGSVAALTAMTLAGAWWHLAVALAIAGIGHALLQIGANRSLADDVDVRSQGLAFGIKQSAIPAATMTAGAAVPLIGTQLGWRWAYGFAAAGAAMTLVTLHARRRGRERSRRRTMGLGHDRGQPFTRPQLFALGLAAGLAAGSANALAAFLVEFAASLGTPLGQAGTLLATVSLLGLVTRITIGRLADLHGAAGLGAVAALLGVGGIGFALLPAATSGSALLWVAATLAFAGGWGWPGLLMFIVARENAAVAGSATGIVQSGVFTGAVVGPLLFGFAVTGLSYGVAWRASALAQLLGAVVLAGVLMQRRTVPAGPTDAA
jgi:MFS family permease